MNQQTQKDFHTTSIWKHKEKIIISILFAFLAIWLLGEDSKSFLSWWLVIWMMGCFFMPFTGMLFSGFRDKGWMFSKVIAIAISGYITWLLSSLGILKFTSVVCLIITLLCIGANFFLAYWQSQKKRNVFPANETNLIFWEEVLLFLTFLLWTYVAGFRPQAFGEEKFMDFGFMAAMMRSAKFPATDIWYSLSPINYYYGGQYYAVFLTKLTGTQIAVTYHLMRTLMAGMAFALPFSLVRQVAEDFYKKRRFHSTDKMAKKQRRRKTPDNPAAQTASMNQKLPEGKRENLLALFSGLLAGIAVSLAGNMHYVIYGLILPLWKGQDYWFPDSTRYIGHNPPTEDATIHEFPSYSFLQGDLHAHVVNIFFVLTVLGLLYAWMKYITNKKKESHLPNPSNGKTGKISDFISKNPALFQMHLLMCGVFLGIFQWSNAWDFAIYFVVICGVCFFCNLARLQDWKSGIIISAVQWIEMLLLSFLVGLPFTLQFDSSMAQGIRFAKNHSAFYQLCILWALPVILIIGYLIKLFLENGRRTPLKWLAHTQISDLYVAVLSLCALGLVLMPELIYLRDIYESTAARSNTMFKLTYQAFILFGISMGFILVRFLADKPCKWIRPVGILGAICLLMTSGYTATAAKQWYGEVWDKENYQGLDATAFLETEYPADAPAIRWLQSTVDGNPVVLEAPGDSYSRYCRVSAMTGLPTIEGWYVHEWLWRNNTNDLNEKKTEIETIYTATDEAQVRSLLEKYQVAYIFIGQMEREAYPALNETLLRTLGDVVFDQETVIIQVNENDT